MNRNWIWNEFRMSADREYTWMLLLAVRLWLADWMLHEKLEEKKGEFVVNAYLIFGSFRVFMRVSGSIDTGILNCIMYSH